MGKKTNWTVTEDQTLCRAWLHASDAVVLQEGDYKAETFWNIVAELFHDELDTSIVRPHSGLKVRWTRINKDVQKFATIFEKTQQELMAKHATLALAATTSDHQPDEEPQELTETQVMNAAKEQFYKAMHTKFLFDSCWRVLRFSPKWNQLLAHSSGLAVQPAAADASAAQYLHADVDGLSSVTARAVDHGVTDPSGAIASNGTVTGKRRMTAFVGAYGRGLLEQLCEITTTLSDEMKTRNELLEEQNAIALFRAETDLIEDDDARECMQLLRRKYIKKMRTALEASGDANDSSYSQAQDEGTHHSNSTISVDVENAVHTHEGAASKLAG